MPYSPGLTSELKRRVSELYALDPSPKRVGAALGVSAETVDYHVKKSGQHQQRKLVTQTMRDEMVRRYADGESSWEIGSAMGFLNVCVIKNLNKAGVQLRDRSTAAKTYSVNQNYFKEIDSPTKAYLLGLIWADGNMSKDSFTLALKDSDKPLLESVRTEIGSTGPLNFRKRQERQMSDMWALRVHDKRFCAHLRALGIVERKTSKLRFPAFLPCNLYPMFILGIVDGDGCVGEKLPKGPHLSFNIAGSEQMV